MATIIKRQSKAGVHYLARVRLKGFPEQTATFERLTDARKWIQDTESAIREGRHFRTAAAKRHTSGDAIERYSESILPKYKSKEQANRKPILAWWSHAIGDKPLADLDSAVFAQCRDQLANTISFKGGKLSPDTIKKYFQVAASVLKVCVNEWKWLEHSPLRDGRVELPELPRGRVRFLDDAERERLLDACRKSSNPVLHCCVVVSLATGLRQSELMTLCWHAVNLKTGTIVLEHTKNNQRRTVPLVGRALELLREHSKIRQLNFDLVFPSTRNPAKPIDLKRPWRNCLHAAEIVDFRWHDLRHSCASYLAMNGASTTEIAAVLGHRTLAMTARYAHLSESHIRMVLAEMNNRMFGDG